MQEASKNYSQDPRKRRSPAPAPSSFPGIMKRLSLVVLIGVLALAYQSLRPPPPKICGSPDGPPVTATRTKLKDGRHIAYIERGVPKEEAKHKIIFVHGFDGCRFDIIQVSPELMEEMGIYLLGFDRPGYGESDPHPGRTEKSIAMDIEELADNLNLGPKFYLIGFSMGGEIMWSCLKFIPHRLAGVAIVAPVANFWWSGLPANVTRAVWDMQLPQDKWAVSVAHHAPWLTYWWNTQKLFPASSVISFNPAILCDADRQLMPKFAYRASFAAQVRQQGEFESLHRDMNVGFGRWSWSPLEMEDPFPGKDGAVQLWHGADDLIVPAIMSRYVAERLPWVRYRELPRAGHMLPLQDGLADDIAKSLLLGE